MKVISLLTGLVLLLSANLPLAETLNRVVAVVNDDVILESELSSRETMIVDQLRQQQAQLPSRPSLRKQVLDRLVLENLQLQLAERSGIRVDDETLNYLRLSGRPEDSIALVEAYAREQQLFLEAGSPEATYTKVVELDLGSVEPSLAGPKRPQDRVPLRDIKPRFQQALAELKAERNISSQPVSTVIDNETLELDDGAVLQLDLRVPARQ